MRTIFKLLLTAVGLWAFLACAEAQTVDQQALLLYMQLLQAQQQQQPVQPWPGRPLTFQEQNLQYQQQRQAPPPPPPTVCWQSGQFFNCAPTR